MRKTKVGERPDASIVVTTCLRRQIASHARKGESVDATLRRLFRARGHGPVGSTEEAVRMLLSREMPRTSIRVTKALKAWIVNHMKGYEATEHAILRLAGLKAPTSGDANGR